MSQHKPPRIVEPISVIFEDQNHFDLHQVLIAFGFSFEIFAGDFRVGLMYHHADKRLDVELSLGQDGTYRAAVADLTKDLGERIHTEENYSSFEWDWMEDADNEAAFLERELHILCHVRPNSLQHIPKEI